MQIGESFKQYGLSASVTNVLVGRFDANVEQVDHCLQVCLLLKQTSQSPDM